VLRNVIQTHRQNDVHESKTGKEKKNQVRRIREKIDKIDTFLITTEPKQKTRHGEKHQSSP
jgi:predicted RNase H-like nuclease